MKSLVRFPVLSWGFFLEGEDSHSDNGLGSLVEHRFKALPGTSYITTHLIGTIKSIRTCGGIEKKPLKYRKHPQVTITVGL
jgi:hypothetical protein